LSLDPTLAAFCRVQHPRLVGLLSLYCGDALVGEELAQEALARACRDWSKVRRLQRPEAWATRVALNLANSHFRRRRYERRARERLGAGAVRGTEPADAAAAVALRRALLVLPQRQRGALVLRYYSDLPVTEIAEMLECPVSTAKSHIRRGLARLRAHPELFDVTEENSRAI
jgi:RNA polymerase sigma factor (sigma-70 family)